MPRKVTIPLQTVFMLVIFIFLSPLWIPAQNQAMNKYGLVVIRNIRMLKSSVTFNKNKRMIGLNNFIPGILLDLRYASSNNFMHQHLYPSIHDTYLRMEAARLLQQIQKELNDHNLGLKVFDAYRPYSITEKMWEPVRDDRYVADPRKGSNHNRGIAIDLTLIDANTKQELNMGTGFDNFSDSAHTDFAGLPPEVLANRKRLKNLMEKYGFKSLETEWWHFSLPNANDFELLDLNFKKMKRLQRGINSSL
jgi:D-alanyl-D-alanine dipeptidase